MKTTRANITDRLDRMRIQDLPKTIQDAIFVARKLGFAFIWVDSLCVVQDDPMDVQRELSQLSEIFSKSALTISAASAESSQEGFLQRRRPPDRYFRLPFLCPDGEVGSILLSNHGSPASEPIHRRAWTLQEHLLASRILVYGSERLRWSCHTKNDSDGKMNFQFLNIAEWLSKGQTAFIPSHYNHGTTRGRDRNLRLWRSVIDNYSRRKLTFISDQLVAISAVAEKVGQRTNGTYLAGLWKESLAQDLLWASYDLAPRRPSSLTAPSWSWASLEGHTWWPAVWYPKGQPSIELLEHEVQLDDPSFPYGSVRRATLKVKAHLHRAVGREHATNDEMMKAGFAGWFSPPHAYQDRKILLDPAYVEPSTLSESVAAPAVVNLDTPYHVDSCYVLETIGPDPTYESFGKKIASAGLVVKADGKDCFRRIGTYRIFQFDTQHSDTKENTIKKANSNSWVDGSEKVVIRLV